MDKLRVVETCGIYAASVFIRGPFIRKTGLKPVVTIDFTPDHFHRAPAGNPVFFRDRSIEPLVPVVFSLLRFQIVIPM
ncbi:MAG: hypothetical protein QF886_02810, partial [Planctomycetota bacterium]|nr:hypothetical protein [Planctomycetota bacterium]